MTIFGFSKGQMIAAGAAGFAAGVVVTEVVERTFVAPVALTASARDKQRQKLAKLAEADKAKGKAEAEADAKKAAAAVKAATDKA